MQRKRIDDRKRMVDPVEFDYQLEMCQPAAVGGEIKDLARWLELDLTMPG